jgi:hypothetical protein
MTFSVFCANLLTPLTFDSLGAVINAACKFAKEGAVCTKSKEQTDLRWNAVISKSNV